MRICTHLPVNSNNIHAGRRMKVTNFSFYGIWKSLLAVFASSDSLAFFLSPIVVCIVSEYVHTGVLTTDMMTVLTLRCPVLGSLFSIFGADGIPVYAHKMFTRVVAICQTSLPFLYHENADGVLRLTTRPFDLRLLLSASSSSSSEQTVVMRQHSVDQQVLGLNHIGKFRDIPKHKLLDKYEVLPERPSTQSGVFYKSWPKIRQACRYPDLESKKIDTDEWADTTEESELTDIICKKQESRRYVNKDMIAGIFVTTCVHTIMYGFQLMLAPEGRKEVLKVLYERMPAEILDHLSVIYDAACQAGEYCMRREPELFACTNFFVDRFHGMTHTCSNFWKLAAYPGLVEVVSSSSESLNDFLQQFHSQVAYMKQSSVMRFVAVIGGVRNWIITKKHTQALNTFNAL